MYLFVFFWTPALQAAQRASLAPGSGTGGDLPFGIIFASFMAAMTAASLAFGLVSAAAKEHFRPSHLLVVVLAASTLSFWRMSAPATPGLSSAKLPVLMSAEQATFWLFCLFEACVGLYWPCVGLLRGAVVPDAVRARVYAWLRVPLNLFVVVSLLLTREREGAAGAKSGGEEVEGFRIVFATCAKLLAASTVALWGFLARQDHTS